MRNPDGTFKSGDPETRETARRGGEASGGSRAAQQGQRHAKRAQPAAAPGEGHPAGSGKFQDNSERARESGRKGGVAAHAIRPKTDEADEDEVPRRH